MSTPVIRLLEHGDASRLLDFELKNRDWFEQHIEARDPQFYTAEGVARHIAQYLAGYADGAWHPCVLLDPQGAMIGRANLKDIDRASGSAEVGYRIAQQETGKGLATMALAHLIELARSHWGLTQLTADITLDNAASAAVLRRCGFVPATRLARMTIVGHQWVDGERFSLRLTQPEAHR